MSDSDNRFHRAVKRTPAQDKSRYSEEWQHDMKEAGTSGLPSEADASRGALRMATHLRQRWLGRLLLGDLGFIWAVAGWVVLAIWALAAFLLGNLVLLLGLIVFVVVTLALSKAGVHTTWSYVAMVASVLVGTAAAAFVGWVFSVRLDAADAMVPEPEITRFGGVALILVGLSALVFAASVIFAAVRQSKINRAK